MSGSGTIAYQSPPSEKSRDRFSFENITSAPRDIYVPTGLLIAGFLAMVAWSIFYLEAGRLGVAVVTGVLFVQTLIKTAILIGLAIVIAPHLGISFGEFRTAVLKFAAIIIFTDAVLLWLEAIMDHLGALPPESASWRRWRFVGLIPARYHTALPRHPPQPQEQVASSK